VSRRNRAKGRSRGVFSNSSFRTGFDFLSDGRRAPARSRLFIEEAAAFAREHEREFGRCRWASVVADLGADDAARLLTIRAGLGRVEVSYFFDIGEARRWLCGGRGRVRQGVCGDVAGS
jgi:hypothetical protein